MQRQHHQPDLAGSGYSKTLEKHSKALSYLLRHSDEIALRPDGYVQVSDVLERLGTKREELLAVVAASVDRQGVPRFEIAQGDLGECIRATGKRTNGTCKHQSESSVGMGSSTTSAATSTTGGNSDTILESASAPKELVVTVVSVTGEVVWGPTVQMSTTLTADLVKQISKILGQPTIALKLVQGTRIITSTLECLQDEAEPTIQCIVDASIIRAKSIFERFLDCFSEWGRECDVDGLKDHMRLEDRYPVRELERNLDGIRRFARLDDLPDELATWLPVLLSSRKCINVDHHFLLDLKCFHRQAKLAWPPSLGPAPGGLVYFSMNSDDGDMPAYVVDAAGELAEIFGRGVPGGVWCTIFAERTWSHFNKDRLSADIWRRERLQSEPRAPEIVHVAPSLQHFFEVATNSKEAMYRAINPYDLMCAAASNDSFS